MSSRATENQVIALAALCQASLVTAKAARQGIVNPAHFTPLAESLFNFNPADTLSVYGGTYHLKSGLDVLINTGKGEDSNGLGRDILAYQFGLLYLENRLHKNREMLESIGTGLEAIAREFPEAADRTSPPCIHSISTLYRNTISTLGRRMQVRGDFKYLNREEISDSVRTALLAGLRAAVLWRQVGGRRWHLLLRRNTLLTCARDMRQNI